MNLRLLSLTFACAVGIGVFAANGDSNESPSLHDVFEHMQHEHGHGMYWKVSIEQLEMRKDGDAEITPWHGEYRLGGDISSVKITSKGEHDRTHDQLKHGQLGVYYNRAVRPFWDIKMGVRHDFGEQRQDWLSLGVEGTAPWWVEVEASISLGLAGEVAIQSTFSQEILVTQRLFLHPRIEINRLLVANGDSPTRSKSVRDYSGGHKEQRTHNDEIRGELRIHYAVTPQIAPYVGFTYEREEGSATTAGLSWWF